VDLDGDADPGAAGNHTVQRLGAFLHHEVGHGPHHRGVVALAATDEVGLRLHRIEHAHQRGVVGRRHRHPRIQGRVPPQREPVHGDPAPVDADHGLGGGQPPNERQQLPMVGVSAGPIRIERPAGVGARDEHPGVVPAAVLVDPLRSLHPCGRLRVHRACGRVPQRFLVDPAPLQQRPHGSHMHRLSVV
jgi:hypothetical protein